MEEKWIFPTNGYGPENGLHSSDLETFMKDPLAALAREICQNSIDAAVETGENNNGAPVKPVEVEFSMFSVPRTKIPGIEEITAEIERCCDYKGNDEKEGKELKLMKKVVNSDEICCLRISDYNTTGLLGAGSNKRDTPFYSLTKGSGVSEKSTGSGGSKGIGKFAAFVASKLHTIFYSTVTKENGNDVAAFLGVSKLRSRPDDRDEELLTMGIGYYGSDEKNNPIKRELVLDENLPQRDGRCGTDIYVIGFAETKNWELDIIAKVLESFMVAIYRGHLSVKVQEQIVDKASLRSIVYNEDFKNRPSKVREYREILAQYEMLVGAEQENEKIERMEIPISEKDNVELYIRLYDETDKTQAIKHCIMVRHPYMKIKHITCQVHIPFSALCIIPRGDLNEVLRRIENPQHTDWELKRLDNFPDEQRMTKERQKELENKIKEAVREHLSRSLGEESDMEGAGEFLPAVDESNVDASGTGTSKKIIVEIRKGKAFSERVRKNDNREEAKEFLPGEEDDNGTDEVLNPGKNGGNRVVIPDKEPRKRGTVTEEGKKRVLKTKSLGGVRFTNIAKDKNAGRYVCLFNSPYTEKKCDFMIRLCGAANDKYKVDIESASVNGKVHKVEDGVVQGIRLRKGKKYRIEYTTTVKGYFFASEVVMNAYR